MYPLAHLRAAELDRKREELDKSEREEAALMVELENLLKEGESSLSLSSNVKNETAQLTATIANYDRRHQILRHLCEEFVAEARKGGSEVGIAMDILLRHGGEMLLSDLKNEMKKEISGNPSLVLSVGKESRAQQ